MRKLLHRLGFHGPNWRPFWDHGNVSVECVVCGAQSMVPFADVGDIPAGIIAERSMFGNNAVTPSAN